MSAILENISKHLIESYPDLKKQKVLLAVSGGVDSMVLLHILQSLGYNVSVAHCNFQLRGKESDLDEEFVIKTAKGYGVECFVKRFSTEEYATLNKLSIQLAARELRYQWFYELLQEHSFDYLFTAHHLDDQIETFFIHLIRGTGLKGLLGIPNNQNQIIRPLLPFTRDQILQYAEENKVHWREDSSNKSNKYLRNKLRNKVIPLIKEEKAQFSEQFLQTITHLQSTARIVNDALENFCKDVIGNRDGVYYISIDKMLKYSNFKDYLYHFLTDFGFRSWKDIYILYQAENGKKVLAKDWFIQKEPFFLVLKQYKKSLKPEEYYINSLDDVVNIPISIKFEPFHGDAFHSFGSDTILIDVEKLHFPLKLRRYNSLDTFKPFGFNGKKKVSKFLKDCKLTSDEKEKIWLLCDAKDEIIWIVGHRMEDKYKIEKTTKTIYKINFQK